VRKVLVFIVASLFFYSLFRDMTVVKTLILACAIAASYGISRLPVKFLSSTKYPLIGVCLAVCPVLFIYPWVRGYLVTAAAIILLSFHGLALFVVTMEEKGKKPYKEVIGLTLLYGVSCLNLYLCHHTELILALSSSVLIFLFIVNKGKIMPYMAACALIALVLLYVAGIPILGNSISLPNFERYLIMGTAFVLLLFAFAGYIRRPDLVTILAFFGLMYVSVDLLLSVGFKIKGLILSQPVLALFIVGPAVGLVMKGEKKGS
jgi:hypothetical protein